MICQTLCFKRRLLLYIKKKEPNRTEPILTKTETNRLYLRTEPPIIPVSRNRNEPEVSCNWHFTARDHSTGCKTLRLIPFWEPLCLVFETKEQHKKQKAASASSRLAEYAHKPDHHVIMDVMLEGNTAGFQMTQAT